jgi:hypothetical protein
VRVFAWILNLALAAALAACGTSVAPSASSVSDTPGPTPETAAPASTTAASVQPTGEPPTDPAETVEPVRWQWAEDPPRPFLMGSAVRVTVEELNLRSRPSTSAAREGVVSRGDILSVSGPPIEADGYIWYQGFHVSTGDLPMLPEPIFAIGEPPHGWFAAWQDQTPYVEQLAARCPDTVDSRNVGAMLPGERLVCFGDTSIELEGTIGCYRCSPEIFGEYAPSWLTNPNDVDHLLWDIPMDGRNLLLRFPPTIDNDFRGGEIIRVRGHFDDARASRCSLGLAYPWANGFRFHPIPDAIARHLCRQEFVVENYEVLGTDPRFGSD